MWSDIKSGFMPWRYWGISPQFNTYSTDIEKLKVIFSNPALLKVITLQCDLFSLAEVYVYRANGKKKGTLIEKDPAYDRLENPNPMQAQAQFLWDFMFWKMVGNAYLYMDSDIVDRDNAPMYWLENHKIEWPLSMDRNKDKLVFSDAKIKELMNTEIVYRYEDGTTFTFKLGKLGIINDLTNGVGNWFKGYSRLDALYKVISNSEISLDAKNINVRFTGKFLVSGQNSPDDVTKLPMGDKEKESIEDRVNGNSQDERRRGYEKQVHAVRSLVDIKRFVDDLRVLQLDDAYLADYFLIGAMFNIPRDVLEAYNSATYENQEKARAGHVSYTLEPVGKALGKLLAKRWGYTGKKEICLSWDHLPFTQVFEKERTSIKQMKAQIIKTMLDGGFTIEQINIFLDENLEHGEPGEEGSGTGDEGSEADSGE